ncbi:Flp pilus assembly complex ATPase component TadA [Candidatus Peregrinibacteria bacterium]|nr:Flp pilus assembly complex ATPase component TadA [Candidatus Peregrinibacteria bacterium]
MPRKTKKTTSKKKTIRKTDNPFQKHALAGVAVEDLESADSPEATETQAPEHSSCPLHHDEWTIHHIGGPVGAFPEETCRQLLKHLKSLDLITDEQIEAVQERKSKEGECVAESIIKLGILKEDELGQAAATFFHCTYVPFKGVSFSPEVLSIIPKEVSQKAGAVAFDEGSDFVKVAMVNPEDLHFIHLLEKKTGKSAEVHFTLPSQISEAMKSYPSEFTGKLDVLMARASENISHLDSLTSVSDIFDSLVLLAYQKGASDVHIEPFETDIRIRFRIDGVLQSVAVLPIRFLETIVNHIKVLAKLRIDTHNAFQDGRFHVTYEETTINFRVSIMPTHYGEKAVLRLLTSETQEWDLGDLGYRAADRSVIEKHIEKTTGMILCCGPTGSGKTTTLYALLKLLNKEGVNISTIEDPIEYGLPGILQTQVNPRTNITYAEGLKSLMRQDPDILMIGEVRDFETGKIAVNAALTGHLILSTLHTNNASLAPLRLLQMGVDPYLITTTVNLIIAQRLVRRICPSCRTSYSPTKEELDDLIGKFALDENQKNLFKNYFETSKVRLFKGTGCEKCGQTGFHGRTVIAETLEMKDNIQELIMASKTESEIEKTARENGMVTMLEDGLSKVKEGMTTLEEVFRVINQ